MGVISSGDLLNIEVVSSLPISTKKVMDCSEFSLEAHSNNNIRVSWIADDASL